MERPGIEACTLGAGPFVLEGTPENLSGVIEFANSGDEKAKLRAVPIAGVELTASTGRVLEQARVKGRLRPFERRAVSASVALEPGTPPGNYLAQVVCGDERAELVLCVRENRRLRVAPRMVRLKCAAGSRQSFEVWVTNEGNVPFEIPTTLLVHFTERGRFCNSFTAAMKEAADQGYAAFLDNAVKQLADKEVKLARVTTDAAENEVLGIGDTRRLELRLTIPSDMKRQTYRGPLGIDNLRISILVECTGPSARGKG